MAQSVNSAIECDTENEETLNDEKQRLVTNIKERQGKRSLYYTPVDSAVLMIDKSKKEKMFVYYSSSY